MYNLSDLSESRLKGLHPDLKRVVQRAIQITDVDFMVVEGRRTLSRQKKLVAAGRSQTLNSRHLTGHAVDLCAWIDGKLKWAKPESKEVADAMKAAADELNVDLEWGGDWRSFKDTPHFQLSWSDYPKQAAWPQDEFLEKPKPTRRSTTSVMRKYSRKWRLLDLVKQLFAFLGLSAGGSAIAVTNTSKANLDAMSGLVTSYGWIGLIGVMGLFFVLMFSMHWLQDKQIEDHEAGAYMPSGLRGDV